MSPARKSDEPTPLENAVRYLAEQLASDESNARRREQGAAALAILDGTDKTPAASGEDEPQDEPEDA